MCMRACACMRAREKGWQLKKLQVFQGVPCLCSLGTWVHMQEEGGRGLVTGEARSLRELRGSCWLLGQCCACLMPCRIGG